MASLTDIYQSILTGIQSLNSLTQVIQTTPRSRASVTSPGPNNIKTTTVGNVSDSQVALANPNRVALFVFNPNSSASGVTLWVAPSTNTDGTTNSATVGAGSMPIPPQQGNRFDGFTTSMRAIASSSAAGAITIWEF